MGFSIERPVFSEAGTPDVENLYARLGDCGPHLMFAGHTDVVPPGDAARWRHPPFSGAIEDGKVWLLIDEVTQSSVKVGDIREDFRGERAKMHDGTAPHKPSSTGRVQSSKGEYFPSVYGCKWIKL